MNPRSLIHVVVAIAVGYLLISALPQQVAMYATPQPMMRGDEAMDSLPPNKEGVLSQETSPETITGDIEELESLETGEKIGAPTGLGALMKWWIFDVVIALIIYLIARRRIA